MDIPAIRSKLKTALDQVSGLTAYTYWPDACSTLPAAMPVPGSAAFWETMSDQGKATFEIHLLAAWASEGFEVGQKALDAFLAQSGSTSVRAALEADPQLGGAVDDCRVLRWRDYHFGHRMYPAGPPAWGAVFDVELMV